MSSADKVALVDTMNRADLGTLATGGAKIVIYLCEVVHHRYSTGRTVLLTLAAGNASVKADLAHVSTLLVARALYDDTGGVLYHFYNAIRAGTGAETASNTLDRIDLGNTAIVNTYSLCGTHAHTVAVAKAGKGTSAVAGEAHVCCTAGSRTVIIVLSFFFGAITVTSNVRNHLDNVLCLNTKHLCYLACGRVATGDTKVGLIGSAVAERLSVAVTSGVAASTAVCTGKALTHGCDLFIFLYAEEH